MLMICNSTTLRTDQASGRIKVMIDSSRDLNTRPLPLRDDTQLSSQEKLCVMLYQKSKSDFSQRLKWTGVIWKWVGIYWWDRIQCNVGMVPTLLNRYWTFLFFFIFIAWLSLVIVRNSFYSNILGLVGGENPFLWNENLQKMNYFQARVQNKINITMPPSLCHLAIWSLTTHRRPPLDARIAAKH